MTVVNGYCTAAEVKNAEGINDSVDDAFVDLSVNAASRRLDNYCQRRFWLDPAVVTRTFVPVDYYLCDLVDPDDGTAADIGSLTGLVVKIDSAVDGTFATTLTLNTDFRVLPVNAASALPEAKPWRSIQMVGSAAFIFRGYPVLRRDTVQVTAKWGWPAVPEAIHDACLLQACRLLKRRLSPEGVAGFGEFGAVRVSRLDPDVQELAGPYRFTPAMAG